MLLVHTRKYFEERIPVVGGHARVPEEPGLGIAMDEAALERYRVEQADHTLPRRLTKVIRPGNLNIYFVNSAQKWTFFGSGNQPVDDWGCSTELLDDDGSAAFADLYQRALEAPEISQE